MRTAQYVRMERRITAADGDGIVERWRYGGRLLADPQATTESGKSLRHGVLEQLIAASEQAGINLSEREIQWRLQAARTYRTEDEIRTAVRIYGAWRELRGVDFPAVDGDPDAPPADHRSEEQKRRAAARQMLPEDGQMTLPFPDEFDPDVLTLADLIKYAREQDAVNARFAERARVRWEYLERCLAAVDGDEGRNWREAHRAAFGGDDEL